jgi:cell wall-associated NlpC family hydrolase
VIKAALAACLGVALAACAAAPPKLARPSDSFRAAPDPAHLMVGNALSMVGQPYRWGGAAPGGFDCSGLVEYAASGAGISVPRTAQEQLRIGTPIARRDVRAGDLVFLHLARKELHVGIALDGDRFVHAPSSGGYIRVDSLTRPPYAKGFTGARRIVKTPAGSVQ